MITIELEVDETRNHTPFIIFAFFQAYRRKPNSKPTPWNEYFKKERKEKKERKKDYTSTALTHLPIYFTYIKISGTNSFQIVDELEISSMQNEQKIQIHL